MRFRRGSWGVLRCPPLPASVKCLPMPSSTSPPGPPPRGEVDGTITGTFVVDEVLNVSRRERPLVSLVLPAFNEASVLRDHVLILLNYLKTLIRRFRFEVIIVNDGSSDETGQIATQLADGVRRDPRLRPPAQLRPRPGAQDGLRAVPRPVRRGPRHRPELRTGAHRRCCSTASRRPAHASCSPPRTCAAGGSSTCRGCASLFSRVANWFLARSSGQNISTMTCMVRAIDGRFLRSLHLRSTGMDVMPEMIHKAKLLRATIEEVPAELNWERQNRLGGSRRSSLRIVRQILGTTVVGLHPAAVHLPAGAGPAAARVRRLREHLDGDPFHRRLRRTRVRRRIPRATCRPQSPSPTRITRTRSSSACSR